MSLTSRSLWLPSALLVLFIGYHSARFHRSLPAPVDAPRDAFEREKRSLRAATRQELERLPGVGTHFAGVFLAARPPSGFASWDDVDRLPGVGPARLRLLQENFTLP